MSPALDHQKLIWPMKKKLILVSKCSHLVIVHPIMNYLLSFDHNSFLMERFIKELYLVINHDKKDGKR